MSLLIIRLQSSHLQQVASNCNAPMIFLQRQRRLKITWIYQVPPFQIIVSLKAAGPFSHQPANSMAQNARAQSHVLIISQMVAETSAVFSKYSMSAMILLLLLSIVQQQF